MGARGTDAAGGETRCILGAHLINHVPSYDERTLAYRDVDISLGWARWMER